jgi:predicted TIM-barrel fold metal-dependent hydrolase
VYEQGIDFAKLDAIDFHTHVEIDSHGHKAYDDELVDATRSYFKMASDTASTVDALARAYRQRNAAAVVFTVDAESGMGHPPNSVDELMTEVARHNDVLIPFGSVDPWKGKAAVRRVHELVGDYGVRGFKFHPSMQAFEPNDRSFYPLYQAIADADFPELTAIAMHKSNVYLDLSGYSPKYFPPQLVRAMSRQLRTKVLFGTDHPYIQYDRWRSDFATLELGAEIEPLVYKENALRVLGITI